MADSSTPIDLPPRVFRELGHRLVDQIADFYAGLPQRAVRDPNARVEIRRFLGESPLPVAGAPLDDVLRDTAALLFDRSLHNGHPRFMGYITSSATPLGALADLLAAAVNANVGLWDLAPAATEIERQAVRWLAELSGYRPDCGGLMVSGGNMANLIGFFAARTAKAPWPIRSAGLHGEPRRLTLYASRETHTWIQKAADLAGLGTDLIRWIDTDAEQRMSVDALDARIRADRADGFLPFLVVGAAGTVGTGATDPLPEIAAIARRYGLWFHVDGAYGAPAASLPEAPDAIRGLAEADSLALDPHKWLYCPLEAGCALVREPAHLIAAFSFHPDYYRLDAADAEPAVNYYEYGVQNSRGFRALKVWLALRCVGKDAYVERFRADIARAPVVRRRTSAPGARSLHAQPEHHDVQIPSGGSDCGRGGRRPLPECPQRGLGGAAAGRRRVRLQRRRRRTLRAARVRRQLQNARRRHRRARGRRRALRAQARSSTARDGALIAQRNARDKKGKLRSMR